MNRDDGLLAICFQESITAIVRLRGGRESVEDPSRFREHMRNVLQNAARDARDMGGYAPAEIRSATFAVVAFLDESILNSGLAAFADWVRKPLQEQLFGTHVAGDVFFENVRELLSQPDSAALADVLEVYSLCLLLGFGGRYTGGRRGELSAIASGIGERIRKIRSASGELSPSWLPENAAHEMKRDPWLRTMTLVAIVLVTLTILLFFFYRFALDSAVMQARELALEVR